LVELLLALELLFQPVPYWELRYTEVVGQTDFYTCGPAAVATLLTYYYGIPTTEAEALELAEGFMRAQGLEPAKGINALALKQTLEAKGILTKGFRVKPEALKDYFDRGGLPLIAHLTEPQKHFVVVVEFVGDQVVLGDPSWGRRIIPFTAIVKEHGYSEIVLVPLPADREIVRTAKERQKATLEWAAYRLAHLANLQEGLP